jgi:hypothetical protein
MITGNDKKLQKVITIITKWIVKLTLLKHFMLLVGTKSTAFMINFHNFGKYLVEPISFTYFSQLFSQDIQNCKNTVIFIIIKVCAESCLLGVKEITQLQ